MDDPFASAAQAPDDAAASDPPAPSTPGSGPLVLRDPDAAADESSEFRTGGAVSFDDLLRRARGQGFLAGAAAGAIGAASVAAILALLTARPATTISAAPSGPEPGAASAEPRAEAPRRAEGGGAAAAGQKARRRQAAAEAPAPSPPPGLDVGSAPLAALTVEDPELHTPSPSAAATSIPAAPPAPAAGEPASSAAPGPAANAARPFPERDVAEALRSRRRDVAECVASTPGDAAAAKGQRFSLTVVIDPSGRVSEAEIDDPEIESTPVGVCLVRVAHEMSFSPFEGRPYRVELALGYGDAD